MLSVCTRCQGDGNNFNLVGFSRLGFEHFASEGHFFGGFNDVECVDTLPK